MTDPELLTRGKPADGIPERPRLNVDKVPHKAGSVTPHRLLTLRGRYPDASVRSWTVTRPSSAWITRCCESPEAAPLPKVALHLPAPPVKCRRVEPPRRRRCRPGSPHHRCRR